MLGPRVMLAYAAERGVDVPALLHEIDIHPAVLANPDGRISLRAARRAWDLAAIRSDDPVFGLHVAECAALGTFEALDYAMWASSTLEEIIDRMHRFYRVIGDDLAIQLVRSAKWVRVRRLVAHDPRDRVESALAVLVLRIRELCGRSFRLHEVRFAHRAPADVRPYRALFRCPVHFGGSAHELVLAAEQLQLPVRTAKPGLAIVLDRHLAVLLGRLPRGQTVLQRVADAIARTLHAGRPSVASTARALHASPRTVQRHLHELGVTHRQMVDDVRREMAEPLLAARGMSISEVAFLLGFEDVSGFRRAYRKWTGASPSHRRSR
ncbi:MAG TPA: AraC family transcriptional regulator [Kofleriaceae bacterium]